MRKFISLVLIILITLSQTCFGADVDIIGTKYMHTSSDGKTMRDITSLGLEDGFITCLTTIKNVTAVPKSLMVVFAMYDIGNGAPKLIKLNFVSKIIAADSEDTLGTAMHVTDSQNKKIKAMIFQDFNTIIPHTGNEEFKKFD